MKRRRACYFVCAIRRGARDIQIVGRFSTISQALFWARCAPSDQLVWIEAHGLRATR